MQSLVRVIEILSTVAENRGNAWRVHLTAGARRIELRRSKPTRRLVIIQPFEVTSLDTEGLIDALEVKIRAIEA